MVHRCSGGCCPKQLGRSPPDATAPQPARLAEMAEGSRRATPRLHTRRCPDRRELRQRCTVSPASAPAHSAVRKRSTRSHPDVLPSADCREPRAPRTSTPHRIASHVDVHSAGCLPLAVLNVCTPLRGRPASLRDRASRGSGKRLRRRARLTPVTAAAARDALAGRPLRFPPRA